MKKSKAWLACTGVAAVFLSNGANAANYTGTMVFQSVEKFAKEIGGKGKKDIDAGAAMTMGYIIGVADSDQAVCPDPKSSVAHYMIAVHEYMKRHPEFMDKNAAIPVSLALREAFPCGGKR